MLSQQATLQFLMNDGVIQVLSLERYTSGFEQVTYSSESSSPSKKREKNLLSSVVAPEQI